MCQLGASVSSSRVPCTIARALITQGAGASLVTIGLTVADSILLVFFANLLSAIIIVLNGRAAAKYHIGFPALARSAFGTYGSYFYVVIRSILGE